MSCKARALAEQHAVGRTARSGSAVNDQRGLTRSVAARFPVDLVAVADLEHPMVVRLDLRIGLSRRMKSSPSSVLKQLAQ